jgi:HTH-type transcriptional regulator/antitoxin HigA
MANTMNMYQPDVVSWPGETLEELLEEREMTQAELAERTGRPKKTINEIIQGKVAITPETALQFERVLGTPAQFWLERERQYREWLARQQDEENLRQQIDWLKEIPIKDLVKRGWIDYAEEQLEQLRAALCFFGIASPKEWAYVEAVFRKSPAHKSDPAAVTAWLRKGELEAQEIDCTPFNPERFRAILNTARILTRASFAAVRDELPRLCASAGVALVIVPELPNTRVCGATRWLSPNKALIQLSLRYKTDDQFWFTFFHEAGHILKHGKRETFIDEEGDVSHEHEHNREAEANRFAADFLIPPDAMQRFRRQNKPPYISKQAVEQFAEELGIASGIVVGRLQHDELLERWKLNNLKRSLRLE